MNDLSWVPYVPVILFADITCNTTVFPADFAELLNRFFKGMFEDGKFFLIVYAWS